MPLAPKYPNRWQRLRAHILATRPPICGWCGEVIDLNLSGNHPRGPSVDHIVPRAQGGTDDRSNLQPAHRRCNTQRGQAPVRNRTSREW